MELTQRIPVHKQGNWVKNFALDPPLFLPPGTEFAGLGATCKCRASCQKIMKSFKMASRER